MDNGKLVNFKFFPYNLVHICSGSVTHRRPNRHLSNFST